jgi:hypothetical protein
MSGVPRKPTLGSSAVSVVTGHNRTSGSVGTSKRKTPDIIWRFRCRTLSQLSVELVVQAHAHDVVGEICVRGDSLWSAGSIRSSAGSLSSPESTPARCSYLRQATRSRYPFFHRSAQPKSQALQMDQTWLQLNASATKRSRHYAANFRFT